jgi:septal ring factor EnvC (AmiA/AmiB activator)
MGTRVGSNLIDASILLVGFFIAMFGSIAQGDDSETITLLKQENQRQANALKDAEAKIEKLTNQINRLTRILDAVQNELDKGKEVVAIDIEAPCYNDLIVLLLDIQDKKNQKASNFAKVHEKASEITKKYLPDLKNRADPEHPIKQQLLWIIRDDLPRVLKGDLSTTTKQERDFAIRLNEIEKLLLLKSVKQKP